MLPKRSMEIYSEIAEWMGIGLPELELIYKGINIEEEWLIKKSVEDFYHNTFYYLFDLMNWEKNDKSAYTQELVRFAIHPNNRVDSVFDYGCGICTDAIAIGSVGKKTFIADIPSHHLSFGIWRMMKRGLLPETIPLGTDIPENDFTICIAVMEHLENPQEALRKMVAKTKYIALRVDPTMEGNGMHIERNFEFLRNLDGMNYDLLREYNLERCNDTDPVIFRVLR